MECNRIACTLLQCAEDHPNTCCFQSVVLLLAAFYLNMLIMLAVPLMSNASLAPQPTCYAARVQ